MKKVNVTLNRENRTASNPNRIAWGTIDALDDLFSRYEYDYTVLTFVGLYDKETRIFELTTVYGDDLYIIDKETVVAAYDNLETNFKDILKLGSEYDNE